MADSEFHQVPVAMPGLRKKPWVLIAAACVSLLISGVAIALGLQAWDLVTRL